MFKANAFYDYPTTYGQIVKLIEFNNNLIVIFEHAIAYIEVNERMVATNAESGNGYIYTYKPLAEKLVMITDSFGSQWPESVIKTPTGVYGVDTVAKKIWKCSAKGFESMSDFKL